MIVQLWIRPETAAAATFRYRTLGVPGKPLPGVIQVQYVLASEAESWKPARHASLLPFFRPIRPRHADHLVTENAPREVPPAVGAAHTRIDARCEHGIARLHGG